VWKQRVAAASSEPGGVAVYVPGRAANYLSLEGVDLSARIRLLDDNPLLHGTYLPGIPNHIESGDTLLTEPAAETLIMSLSFGTRIAERLVGRGVPAACLTTLERLLSAAGASRTS